jgi:hypothetical protein
MFDVGTKYTDDFIDFKMPGKLVEGAPPEADVKLLCMNKFKDATTYKRDTLRAKTARLDRMAANKEVSMNTVVKNTLRAMMKPMNDGKRNAEIIMNMTLGEDFKSSQTRAKTATKSR